MTPKIIQAPRARVDLLEVWEYIARDNVGAADAFIAKIAEKYELLVANPFAGRDRSDILPGIRSFPLGDHLIFYRPIDGGVEIVRVVSGYRDLDSIEM